MKQKATSSSDKKHIRLYGMVHRAAHNEADLYDLDKVHVAPVPGNADAAAVAAAGNGRIVAVCEAVSEHPAMISGQALPNTAREPIEVDVIGQVEDLVVGRVSNGADRDPVAFERGHHHGITGSVARLADAGEGILKMRHITICIEDLALLVKATALPRKKPEMLDLFIGDELAVVVGDGGVGGMFISPAILRKGQEDAREAHPADRAAGMLASARAAFAALPKEESDTEDDLSDEDAEGASE